MSRRRRKIAFSQGLRQRSTHTEEIAWSMLRDRRCLGLKFRRQYGISGFIIDFYCFEAKLAIEIDGSSHGGREEYDAMRQLMLENEGISFIRITGDELFASPDKLVESIRRFVASRSDLPLSSSPGEGLGVRTVPAKGSALPPPPSRSEPVEGGKGGGAL
jgi:very-short-patch-repair endonuclease